MGNAKMIAEIETLVGNHRATPEPLQWTVAEVECQRERHRYSNPKYAWTIDVLTIRRRRSGHSFELMLTAEFWRAGAVDLKSTKWLKILSGRPAEVTAWLAIARDAASKGMGDGL